MITMNEGIVTIVGTAAERAAYKLPGYILKKKIVWKEHDTNSTYSTHGVTWQQGADDVALVSPTSSPIGDYPENNYQPIQVVGTAANVGVISSVHGFHSGMLSVSGLTSEYITIQALFEDGANAGFMLVYDVTAIAAANPLGIVAADTTTQLQNGLYYFVPFNCAGIRFTKSAAVETVTLKGQLSGAS